MSNTEMLPRYDTKLFCEIWEEVNDFIYDYNHLPTSLKGGMPSTDSMTTLYYLLYARYANNPIANFDENQWKYKIFSVIFQYGPTWEKRLDIQKKLRSISDDDLLKGAKAIYNTALNPSSAPSTSTLTELEYINQQNTTNYKKSKMDAYSQLWELLDTDVTGEFLDKFRKCFKQFVQPEKTFIYVTDLVDDDEEEEENNG